jgi:hypothetical protein
MKKLLLTSAIVACTFTSGAFAQSIDDLEVNKYDCSVEEVANYMNKRTSSIKKDTGIATWGDFKENAVYITSASQGGTAPESILAGNSTPDGINPTAEGEGGLFAGCPTFNMPKDMSWSIPDFSSIKDMINGLGGGMTNPFEGARALIDQAIADMIEKITEKGFCERLRDAQDSSFMAGLEEQASKYAEGFRGDALDELNDRIDGELSEKTGRDLKSWTGSDLGGIVDGDSNSNAENNIINNALSDSSGGNGKLLNVHDERLDNNRERAKEKEVDRQKDKLTNRILGR